MEEKLLLLAQVVDRWHGCTLLIYVLFTIYTWMAIVIVILLLFISKPLHNIDFGVDMG